MKNEHQVFVAMAVAVLLILTAAGNAWAMLIIPALGLLVGVLMFRKKPIRRALVLATACALAGMIVGVFWFLEQQPISYVSIR